MTPGRPTALLGGGLVRLGVLLTAVMAVSNLVQFALGALGPLVVDDLGVSRTGFGLLVTAHYLVAGVASVLVGGWVDRAGARSSIAVLLGLGVLAGVALAIAPSYPWLFAGLVFGGVVAAMSNPATNLALTTVSGRRGAMVGVKQSGVQGGSLLAGLALPPVGLIWGWQAGFLVCAGLSLVCLAGLGAVPRRSDAAPAATVWAPVGGGVLRLAGYALFMGAGMTNVSTYLVLYAHEQVGLGARLAAGLLAVVGVVVMLAVITDAPADRTAVASGQVQAAFFLGLCASPPVFGLLVDGLDSYPAGWAWTAVCFAAAAAVLLARKPTHSA